ncbi:hypothetical protein AB9E30_38230, partial [Rhizobium leguminosarum]
MVRYHTYCFRDHCWSGCGFVSFVLFIGIQTRKGIERRCEQGKQEFHTSKFIGGVSVHYFHHTDHWHVH